MKNVRIGKTSWGYFLAIINDYSYNELAVTAEELLTLLKILKEREEELLKEVKEK